MHYIAVDFEWNQAGYYRKSNVQLDGEIIQIGAVKMDESFNVLEYFAADIKPVFYRKIHKKVKELTGIDQKQLNSGKDFLSIIEKFKDWCGDEHIFLTWGPDDSRIMMQNLLVHRLDTQWMGKWINLQVIYSMQAVGENLPMALEKVVEFYGVPVELEVHNALNDARYTAMLCEFLDVKRGMEEYSNNADLSGLKRVSCGNYKVIYGCTNKQAIFAHDKVKNLRCPYCNVPLSELKAWVKQSGDRYITIGRCNKHDLFVGKLKFSREKDGKLSAKYMMYTADKADEQYYMNRLKTNSEKSRKKRKKKIAEKKLKAL
ncbi:MAG: exonuclease domain-containing protein [Clostridia bacterium]|nr:exonuclease domain-containing protein [Clostridia bacterium]